MPLGLISSELTTAYWAENARRSVAYAYPNGSAQLMALLAAMDSDPVPFSTFGWQEDRYTSIKTQTAAGPGATGNKTGPFATAGSTTASGDSDGIFSLTVNGTIRVYVDSSAEFQEDDVVRLVNIGSAASGTTATSYKNVTGRVTTKGSGYVEIAVLEAVTNILNGATPAVDKYMYLAGSGFAQGARSRLGRYSFPVEVSNYTQIHKTVVGPFSRTALKEPLKFMSTGEYERNSKRNMILHMEGLEQTTMFGVRNATTAVDPDTGQSVSRKFAGGIYWFLEQWEKGGTGAGGAFEYGQENVFSQTDWRTYTNKRIIKLDGATISRTDMDNLFNRAFERTTGKDFDKVLFCGPDFITKLHGMYERYVQLTTMHDKGINNFKMEFKQFQTLAGNIYIKHHPLFNEAHLRSSAFIIDLGSLMYRPLNDTDTQMQYMIQQPDFDGRKDQWITECSLEVTLPESCMFIDNLGGLTL